jgi:hypothetical protein
MHRKAASSSALELSLSCERVSDRRWRFAGMGSLHYLIDAMLLRTHRCTACTAGAWQRLLHDHADLFLPGICSRIPGDCRTGFDFHGLVL